MEQPIDSRMPARQDAYGQPQVWFPGPAYGPDPGYGQEQHMHSGLSEYMHALRNRKWLVLLSAGVGALLGFLSTLPRQPVYRAATTVEIQPMSRWVAGIDQVDPEAASYVANEVNLATHIQILKSASIRRTVSTKLLRESIPTLPPVGTEPLAKLRHKTLKSVGSSPRDPLASLRRGVDEAAASLDARQVRGSRILEISCLATHPQVAADFVNGVANEFASQTVSTRLDGARRTSQWLLERIQEVRVRLHKSESQLIAMGQTGLEGEAQRAARLPSVAETKLQRLQSDLARVQSERLARQVIVEAANGGNEDALREFHTEAHYRLLQGRVAELRKQAADLKRSYLPAHYKVQQAEAAVREAENAVAAERTAILARLRTDYETLVKSERVLQAEYDALVGTVPAPAGSRSSAQANLLRREVESDRQLYNLLLQQMNQASLALAVQTNSLRVIDAAAPPSKPVTTLDDLSVGLGAAIGMVLSSVLLIVRRARDTSVSAPGRSVVLLRTPELAVIPSGAAGRPKILGWQKPPTLELATTIERPEIASWTDKPSWMAESFRRLLASLHYAGADGPRPRIILISSPSAREGKSTVACNLAITLSEIGQRVVLVDADLRKPRLHTVLDVPNAWGLVDLIRGNAPIDGYPPESLVCTTQIPGVFLLPAGPSDGAVTDILYSKRLRELFNRLRREYDYVIVDSAPLLPFADSSVVGRLADGAILVFRSGSTEQSAAQQAARMLDQTGVRLLGTVLNDWDPNAQPAKPYQDYHNYYYSS